MTFEALPFRARSALLGGDVALVSVAGELDLYTVPAFASALDDAIATDAAAVVVDLTATTFMDSTALGTLVHRTKVLGRRGRVAVMAADSRIRRVFDVTGLSRVYHIHGSVGDALVALAPESVAA
jgi:anti-sigma B factor antagonist